MLIVGLCRMEQLLNRGQLDKVVINFNYQPKKRLQLPNQVCLFYKIYVSLNSPFTPGQLGTGII